MKSATLMIAAMFASTVPAHGQEIVRHIGSPTSVILTGVTIPPGSETVILSGQLASPINPTVTEGVEAYGDTRTQTVSIFNKIKGLLGGMGYTMADIVKLTVFVTADPKMNGRMDFAGFNAGYREFFGTADNPHLVARSTVQVAGLAGPNFLIEIEAMAAKAPSAVK